MAQLSFTVTGARAEPYAAVPTLAIRLRIEEATGERVQAIALRCQIQIEPRQRRYSGAEESRLLELFGRRDRWPDTLRTLLWTHAAQMVPGFQGSVEVDLPVSCSYDFEVAAAKYFHALDDGEIPLLLLFNGSVFTNGANGFCAEPVPWDREAPYRLPVAVWRQLMDLHFPGSAWLRLRRDSFDALHRFKAERALPSWEEAIEALLEAAAERERV